MIQDSTMAHRCLRKHSDKQQCTLTSLAFIKDKQTSTIGFISIRSFCVWTLECPGCTITPMITLDIEGLEYCEGTGYVQKVVPSFRGDIKRQTCLTFKLQTLRTLKTNGMVIYNIGILIQIQDKR